MNETEMLYYAIGGVVLLIVVVYLVYRMMRPVDKFADMIIDDDFSTGETGRNDIVLTARKSPEKLKKQSNNKPSSKSKPKSKSSRSLFSSCEHNYEVTGFPADKIGTHVNITCTKCGDVQTVTVEESRQLLLQRDDVRQAVNRSRI